MTLQTVTITPKYVNAPKEGKKYGTIKTAEGMSYAAGASITSQCQPGVPVTLEWEGQQWSGSPVMVVNRIVQQQASGHNGTTTMPPNPPPPTHDPYAPAVQQHQGARYPRPTWTDRQIFVLGMAQRTMQTGQFPLTELEQVVLAADAAFDALLRKHGIG